MVKQNLRRILPASWVCLELSSLRINLLKLDEGIQKLILGLEDIDERLREFIERRLRPLSQFTHAKESHLEFLRPSSRASLWHQHPPCESDIVDASINLSISPGARFPYRAAHQRPHTLKNISCKKVL